AYLCRSRKSRDRIVVLEDDRVGQLANFIEPFFSEHPLSFSFALLIECGPNSRNQRQQKKAGCNTGSFIALDEFGSVVRERVRSRAHRQSCEVASNVL